MIQAESAKEKQAIGNKERVQDRGDGAEEKLNQFAKGGDGGVNCSQNSQKNHRQQQRHPKWQGCSNGEE